MQYLERMPCNQLDFELVFIDVDSLHMHCESALATVHEHDDGIYSNFGFLFLLWLRRASRNVLSFPVCGCSMRPLLIFLRQAPASLRSFSLAFHFYLAVRAKVPALPKARAYYASSIMNASKGAEKSIAKPKPKIPEYCDVPLNQDEHGKPIWPAPEEALEDARAFIRECAASSKKTLIVPDKDADGLCSGVTLYRTLVALGLDPALISVHLIKKGTNIHDESERAAMAAKKPGHSIVLDQGSRAAPPVVDDPNTKSLILDHHLSDEFPKNAVVASACHYPPVATTSLLTYEICKTLEPTIAESCAYLCCIGTHGDLGNALKWAPPFPNMSSCFKVHTKKSINDAVSLLNAPRRTAKFDVITAWNALMASTGPKDLLSNTRLQAARAEINAEVELNTHTAPKFSQDGRIAVLRIHSAAQVHPVIATRWAGYLNSKALEIVMVANSGYIAGMVNFSCRIARCARNNDPPVNIIESLKSAADLSTDGLREKMGENFARGHKEASGGVVPMEAFEEFMKLLKVGEKPDRKEGDDSPATKKKVKMIEASPQKNTLGNYFKKRDG
jgi:nanoRNase/pAp phosphatase (c-di-AMP/oligoRNAs hydrolase)